MTRRTLASILSLLVAIASTGCAGRQTVTLRVLDDEGAPVHGATVSAVSLGTSDIPLPVTLETISEAAAASDASTFAVTNQGGLARLSILKRSHAIAVSPPAFEAARYEPSHLDSPSPFIQHRKSSRPTEEPGRALTDPARRPPPRDTQGAWLWTLDPKTGFLAPPSDRPNPPGLQLIFVGR